MLRSSLLTAGACALAVSAAAQTSTTPGINRDIHRVQGQVKHAGVYHVATGTWTRARGSQANVGPDVIYNSSIGSGYYFGGMTNGALAGLAWLGSGNIPTASYGGTPFATQPNRTRYTVNCFEFAYCDTNTGTAGWEFTFYDNATPCQETVAAPIATFNFPGLPNNGGCWTVSFDLTATNPPSTFCLEGDGGATSPGWDGDDPTLDNFGYKIRYLGTGTAAAGVLLSGDPQNDEAGYVNPNIPANCVPVNCPAAPIPLGGNATYYNPAGLCAAVNANSIAANAATGRMTRDFWLATDNTPGIVAPEGCYYFGGYFNQQGGCGTASNNPYAAAYMVIAAAAGECGSGPGGPINGGVQYCTSNPNSTGATTQLDIQGNLLPSLNDCTLTASSMPLNSFGYFITSRTAGFTANPAGSRGNLCVSGQIGRFTGPGQIKNSGATGTIALDTPGEWSLSAIPTSTGPYSAATGIVSHFQLWHRDTFMGNATSNFSNARSVTWL
jgi:hypothetical protein